MLLFILILLRFALYSSISRNSFDRRTSTELFSLIIGLMFISHLSSMLKTIFTVILVNVTQTGKRRIILAGDIRYPFITLNNSTICIQAISSFRNSWYFLHSVILLISFSYLYLLQNLQICSNFLFFNVCCFIFFIVELMVILCDYV